MKSIYLNFNGINIKFSTNFENYFQYFKLYFDQIILKDQAPPSCDIDITFDWTKRSLQKFVKDVKRVEGIVKIGANTFVGENCVATVRKIERRWKILFDVKQSPTQLVLHAYLKKKQFKDLFRFGPLNKPAHEWFFNVTYYLFYYPLFWFLATRKKMYPLHASALEFDKKGIVICGLEGIGKTSLGLKFLQEEDAHFLSDNLILYDNEKVFPCYELVRMHEGDDILWKNHFEKLNTFKILKGFYKPVFSPNTKGIAPEIIIFPEFSPSFFVKEISSKEAVNRALILSHLPAELNHYLEYRHLFNLLDLTFDPQFEQHQALSMLFAEKRCLRIGMLKDDGLNRNYNRIKEIL